MAQVLLDIIIQFAIFSLLLKIVDKPSIKKIKKASNVDEALHQKKRLLEKRKKSLYAFLAVLVIIHIIEMQIAIDDSNDPKIFYLFIKLFASLIILPIYLNYSNKHNKILGNLSTTKALDFLVENDEFVLYLRGFESDVYDRNKVDDRSFSEDIMSKVIQTGLELPFCAVGMTKEVDCPLGGIRGYVNDATWETEVLELMNKAKKIIYLVNDRESCIWEIKNSKHLFHKCVFVVDDLVKYDNVKSFLSGTLDLPDIPVSDYEELPLEYDPRCFYFTSDKKMHPFSGELSDYCQMIGLDADSVSESDIKDENNSFFTSTFFICVMLIAAIITIKMIIEQLQHLF